MRCNRKIVYGWKTHQSMKKYKSKIIASLPFEANVNVLPDYISKFVERLEPCNGELESQIELEWIPYMGGSDAVVEVRIKCKKCGHEFSGELGLPSDLDGVNKFLTEVISKL